VIVEIVEKQQFKQHMQHVMYGASMSLIKHNYKATR